MIGRVVADRYEITRRLGEGGMGAVYEATHLGTRRRVALKVVSSTDPAKNAELLSRFQREARAVGALDTQHIVQVLDSGVDPDSRLPFLAMELLNGEDLQTLVARAAPLAPDLGLKIAAQACLGLAKAHQAGVVHRDIKPGNLFLTRREGDEVVVKLLDFGIAKVADPLSSTDDKALTRTGSMLGSPLYMSPEQAMGLKTVDLRTDIWSLGAVLYEMLTGRTPHQDIDTLGKLIVAIVSNPAPPIQQFAPWLAPEIAAIVHTALGMEPAQRYPSAGDMLGAIRALLPGGLGITEAELVPMSAELRSQVAERIPAADEGRASAAALIPSGRSRDLGSADARTAGSTMLGVTSSRSASRSSAAPVVLGVIGVLGLGALGAWAAFGRADTVKAVTEPSAANVPPVPEPGAPAPAATVAVEPARSVPIEIDPPNARVELDGKVVPNANGSVMLEGALGSVHSIRISLGQRETRGEVVIGEAGAVPKRVSLGVAIAEPKQARPPGLPARATAAASARRAGAATAAPAPTRATLDKTFE
jgi:serine/threonine-protein kinase